MKIGSIYVEVRGDYSKYKEDLQALKITAAKDGKEVSDALNNAISPTQAANAINKLNTQLMDLSKSAKVPAENFKITSEALAKSLGNVAQQARLSEKEFAKLTERMLQTQASKNAEKALNDIAKAAGLSQVEMQKLGQHMGVSSQAMETHSSVLAKVKANLLSLVAAVTAVYYAIAPQIKAYMESETALLKMGMAMKNQGDFTRQSLADMEAFSKQIQRTTAYEDDATLAVMANLKSFGLSNEQVKLATKAALDLATAKANEGMTVERASEILGKSYLGISTGLKKLGIQVDETASKSELFNSVMMQIENRFGGSAQAELLTYAGQWKQLKNQFQDVQEFLGLVFLKTMAALKMSVFAVSTAFTALFAGVAQGVAWIGKGIEGFLRIMGSFSGNTGLIGLAEGMGKINKSLQDFADFERDAAKGAAKLTVENYNQMTSFDNVSDAIDKMGKAGQRTRPINEEGNKKWVEFWKQASMEMAKADDKYWGEFREKYEKGYILAKGNKEREVLLNQWAASESGKILEKIELDELKVAAEILSKRQNDSKAEIDLILNRARQMELEKKSKIEITAFTFSETTRLAQQDFDNRVQLDNDRLKYTQAISQKELMASMDLVSAREIEGKKGLDREVAEAEAAAGKRILAAKFEYDQGKINLDTYLNTITSANMEKDAKIAKSVEDNSKWIINVYKSMGEDIAKFTGGEVELRKNAIEAEYQVRKDRMGENILLEKWREVELKKIEMYRIASTRDFYSSITGYEDEYRKNVFDWIDKEQKRRAEAYKDDVAAAKWARDEKIKFDAKVREQNIQNIQQGLRANADAFEDLSTLYAKDSSQRKTLHDISMAFNIAEKAALAAQAVNAAVVAIATQGSGDPYTAFARVAAMAAAMAALLASVGIAFGGGGGGGGEAATTAVPILPASTVLGAVAGTGSESISKGWELLKDTYNMEYRELSGIYNEMKNLNANITGLVTSLVRTGGIGAANISTGYTPGAIQQQFTQFGQTSAFGHYDILNKISLGFVSALDKLGGDYLGKIFGGGIERWISGTGIATMATTIKDLLAGGGIGAQAYTRVTEKHEGGWFGKDWYSGYATYQELNENISNMLDKVFKNIGSTLVSLAEGLGVDTIAAMNYIFEATEINLQGMNTEEINKTLSEYFSKIGDIAVETLFGDMLKGYQEINEGLLETATRLLIDKTVILSILEMTNKSFTGTTAQAIEFSEALIDIAGDFEKLQEAAQTYYDAFFSDAEKQARLETQLIDAMATMNLTLPSTRAGYRALVEGLDLTTQSGMEAYVALLDMAGAADQYYSTLEDAMEATANSSNNLATSLGNLTLSLQEQMALVSAAWGGPPVTAHAAGGLTSGISIAGESGPEWIVPTYEPQRSSFLRDVGANPEAIGQSIAKHLGNNGRTINFTWSGNIISTDKSPERIAKEIVRPLKAELRRLEAMGTA